MAGMKRSRENGDFNNIDMAKCLMLLSQSLQSNYSNARSSKTEVFECKTCGKKFPSFQALGGHRASHKRPRVIEGEDSTTSNIATHRSPFKPQSLGTTKPKMHECSICGQEFGLGQALGGHMRKHRAAMVENGGINHFDQVVVPKMAPVFRRSSSSKRVFGLDLNLTPLENDLEILFGKKAPKVDVSLF